MTDMGDADDAKQILDKAKLSVEQARGDGKPEVALIVPSLHSAVPDLGKVFVSRRLCCCATLGILIASH